MAKTPDEKSIKTEDHDSGQSAANHSPPKRVTTPRVRDVPRKSWSSWSFKQVLRYDHALVLSYNANTVSG